MDERRVGARVALAQDELLLVLLGLLPEKPVNGWGVLERELALLRAALEELGVEASVPGGDDLRVLVDLLEMEEFIVVRNRRTPTATKFALTMKGIVEAEKVMRRLRRAVGAGNVKRLRKLRVGLDQLGHDGNKRMLEAVERARWAYVVEYTIVSPAGRVMRERGEARYPSYEEAERHAEEYARTLREQGFKVSYNITKEGVLL